MPSVYATMQNASSTAPSKSAVRDLFFKDSRLPVCKLSDKTFAVEEYGVDCSVPDRDRALLLRTVRKNERADIRDARTVASSNSVGRRKLAETASASVIDTTFEIEPFIANQAV